MSNKEVCFNHVDYRGTLEQLGNNFIEVGIDFIGTHNTHKDRSIVDFSALTVEDSVCGTVACHGGWGLVLYGTENQLNYKGYSQFTEGAGLIEQRLGFEKSHDDCDNGSNLEEFALNNPEIWGNTFGQYMFSAYGYKSFGKDNDDNITLEEIGNYYIKVGERILERKDWTMA